MFWFPLTLPQLNFLKKHWNVDCSAWQMSKLFKIPEPEIHKAAIKLKLPPQNLDQLTAFHTPFPFQIAKLVTKFSWANYSEEEPDLGPEQAHSADP